MSHPDDAPVSSDESPETATEAADGAEAAEDAEQPLELTVEITDTGPCKKHLRIVIPAEEVEAEFQELLSELRRDALVPGFRPGHAPVALVQRRYRKEVAEQVKSKLLQAALTQVEKDHEIHAISQPSLDLKAIDLQPGEDLTVELDLEVQPEFALPDYKNLPVRRPVWEITEAMVDGGYQRFLQRYAQEVPKPEGAAAELGDLVTADLQFEKDGVILNTVRERKFQLLPTLQFADGVIPDLGAGLVGARIGDVREATAQVSSSSRDAGLRGQTVRVFIKILDLKSQRLPEVNAAFLALHGFDSVEEVREEIRRMLERRRAYQQQQAVRQAILDPLLKQTPIELPAELVARQERSTLQSLVHQLRQSGLSDNEIRAQEVQIRANAHEATLRSLRELFLLARIAEAENISIEPEDLEQEILEIAERTGESARRVRARLEKEGLGDALATQIIERKTLERILSYAQVENVPLAPPQEQPIETIEEATAAPPEAEGTAEAAAATGDQPAVGGSSEV